MKTGGSTRRAVSQRSEHPPYPQGICFCKQTCPLACKSVIGLEREFLSRYKPCAEQMDIRFQLLDERDGDEFPVETVSFGGAASAAIRSKMR